MTGLMDDGAGRDLPNCTVNAGGPLAVHDSQLTFGRPLLGLDYLPR